MNNNEEISEENIDLEESPGMNADQQANFLNISRSKSADSFIAKLLPTFNDVPDRDRSLVFEPPTHTLTQNIILTHYQREPGVGVVGVGGGLRVFRKVRRQKARGKCDYQKNICGYITKKVIREFVGRHYQQQIQQLTAKHKCSYSQCKSYYLKRVQYVTGPSHLPQLFNPSPNQPQSITLCKRVFRQFYRWFLKERYLRYLLLQGKMTNKLAYIEYKNTNLFRFVSPEEEYESEIREVNTQMRTRSRSVKMEEQQ